MRLGRLVHLMAPHLDEGGRMPGVFRKRAAADTERWSWTGRRAIEVLHVLVDLCCIYHIPGADEAVLVRRSSPAHFIHVFRQNKSKVLHRSA